MDSRAYLNTKMMKSMSANDLHHAIPQTQKYKDSHWERDKLKELDIHPRSNSQLGSSLTNKYSSK